MSGQQLSAASPVVHESDWVDKIVGLVGPSQPSHQTQKTRFQQYVLYVAGPLPILGEIAGSGINQWTNTPQEWGQGWDAYGQRLGSNLAYNAIRQTIGYGISVALGEDNRYFASHKHGAARIGYALVSTVAATQSDGRRRFSAASIAGVAGASAAASVWGPPSYKGMGNISKNAGVSLGVTAAFNVFREFLPDLLHRAAR